MTQTKIVVLIRSIVICFVPAIIGGIATSSSVGAWFQTLTKPSFSPPNWLFGPVWTILYIMQGMSLYFIQTTKAEPVAKRIATTFFYIQLVLNLMWSILFFGAKSPLLGLLEIGLLDITVLFTIIASFRINKKSGYLLIPYMLWISFASYLNYAIVSLNR